MRRRHFVQRGWLAASVAALAIFFAASPAKAAEPMGRKSPQAKTGAALGAVKPQAESPTSVVTVGDWTYNIDTAAGTATVKSYNGNEASVTIPSTLDHNGTTYPLKMLEKSAFAGNQALESVVIPESIVKLGNCAFKNCTKLSSVTIEGNIEDCSKYSIGTGRNHYSSYSVFYNAGSTAASLQVVFGDKATRIPAYLFATASTKTENAYAHITSVTIPDSVQSIERSAFENCYDLSQINWGTGLKTIGDYAFSGNTALASVYPPQNAVSIKDYAFQGCTSLSEVVLPESMTSLGRCAFNGCTSLRGIVLPKSMISLGRCAFKDCTSLGSVEICGNLVDCSKNSINTGDYHYSGYSVFYNAGKYAPSMKVVFGNGVTRIPAYLFATASSKAEDAYAHVTSVTIPDSVSSIERNAFQSCHDLTEIIGGTGLKTIGNYAFCNDTSLTSACLPDNVASVGSRAFSGCTSLSQVVLPKSTSSLGNCVFKDCTNLSQVTINGNIENCSKNSTSTGDYHYSNYSVFYNAGTFAPSMRVVFGNEVTRIPAYLFATASSKKENVYAHVTSVTIPGSVASIERSSFQSCHDLAEVSWGMGLKTIGDYAFCDATSLPAANLPDGVATVGSFAFCGCTSLSQASLPISTISLGNCAFKDCTALSLVAIDGDIESCDSRSKSTNPEYSVFYNAGKSAPSLQVSFGDRVTRIPAYLFATGSSEADGTYAHVTSVTIPDSLASIGAYAFYNCHRLDAASISSPYTQIKEGAFGNCAVGFTLTCCHGSPAQRYAEENGYGLSYLDLDTVRLSSAANVSSGIQLKWTKLPQASGYYIYRSASGGSFQQVEEITKRGTTSWTDTSVKNKNGKTYEYAIKAYDGTRMSGSIKSLKVVRVTGVSISSLKAKSSKKAEARWRRNSKANGYQLQYSTNKSFKGAKSVKISKNSTLKTTLKKGLKKGRRYYIRIRAYKTVSNKKYYSEWSKAKSIKLPR